MNELDTFLARPVFQLFEDKKDISEEKIIPTQQTPAHKCTFETFGTFSYKLMQNYDG